MCAALLSNQARSGSAYVLLCLKWICSQTLQDETQEAPNLSFHQQDSTSSSDHIPTTAKQETAKHLFKSQALQLVAIATLTNRIPQQGSKVTIRQTKLS